MVNLRLHSFGNLEFLTRIPMSVKAGLTGDIINFIVAIIIFFIVGYLVANFMIKKFNYATIGRLGNYIEEENNEDTIKTSVSKDTQATRIITLLGGKENITKFWNCMTNIIDVDACMTRLRVTVKDMEKVADLEEWKKEGALGLMKKDNGVQAVYGPKADVIKSDILDIL